MTVRINTIECSNQSVGKIYQSKKTNNHLVRELIYHFDLSIPDIRNCVGVSTSTIYRWLDKTEEHISFENYQKLLSLYCIFYLKHQRERVNAKNQQERN